MASIEKEVLQLANMLLKHSLILDEVTRELVTHARVIVDGSRRCRRCAKRPVTVTHAFLSEAEMCDHCCAETIVRSSRAFVDSFVNEGHVDYDDGLKTVDPDVLASLMDEESWLDVSGAEDIRRMIRLIEASDEQDGVYERHESIRH